MRGFSKKGTLIVFEGGDCSGKSTVINLVNENLIKANLKTYLTREPGGTIFSENIRNLLLNSPESAGMLKMTEAYLFAASRSELVNSVIIPKLNSDTIILLDRYYFSSFVYQGIVGNSVGLNTVESINSPFVESAAPDLWFYLDVSSVEQERRARLRPEANRLDIQSLSDRENIRSAYLEIAKQYGGIVINAEKTPEEIAEECTTQIINFVNAKLNS